jgi:hypothetical protein
LDTASARTSMTSTLLGGVRVARMIVISDML